MDPAQLAARGWTRETQIHRDDAGRWFQDGEPIAHPGIVAAFNRWVARAPDGRYCLENEINWAYVEIAGPPVFVRSATVDPSGAKLALSDGRSEALDPTTLREGAEGALYCDVRGGTLPARFDRGAMIQLADALHEDTGGLYFELGGRRYTPAKSDTPLELTRSADR